MEFDYTIVDKEPMTLIGMKTVITEGKPEELHHFFDNIVQDGTYARLFSSQTASMGEWNVYTSSPELEGSGKHGFMVASQLDQRIDVSKLDGMRLDFMLVLPAKWLKIRVASREEMTDVHRRTLVDHCIHDIGYQLDFHNNKPILEYQPIACTQTPPYLEFWMPVKERGQESL